MESYRNSLYRFLVYFLLVITTTDTLTLPGAPLCHDHERSALLHFKQSLSLKKSASYDSSAYPKTESWKASGEFSSDCCSWNGVECNDGTGYVTGLHLGSSLLFGTLLSNSTVFRLVHLQTLNLADNNFRNSPVPPEILNLSSLLFLNLSSSSFSGKIPLELSGLIKLTSLDLSRNNLQGSFPVDVFHLPDLLVLNVSNNYDLTGFLPEYNKTSTFRELDLSCTNFSGSLPVSIGNLQSLTKLHVRDCFFSGSIPTSIGNLTQLTSLSLSSNTFMKSVGLPWLEKLSKLANLNISDTNIQGDLPPFLANLTQLTSLDLGFNSFTCDIPLWLMNMTQLTLLSLTSNELKGPIPTSFSQLKNLEYLSLHKNNLIGTVETDTFLSLRKLTVLSLAYNNITLLAHQHFIFTLPKLEILLLGFCNLRQIPFFLRFQNNLRVLSLKGNNIHGKIPHWIWDASDHLEAIDLSFNFLSAMEQNPVALPSKSLRVVDMSNNMLQGNLPIPPPDTIQYSVSNNRLTGDIPPVICRGQSLKVLDLSNNSMSGTIPECLGTFLEVLILENNNFSGTIPPTSLNECDLKVLYLSNNQFTGKVPNSLSHCKLLQILDVSYNQIAGSFPHWLGTLPRLRVLLLHANKFHGAIGSPKIPSQFPVLRIIDLSQNSLTGDLPLDYIRAWNAMKAFDPDDELYINTDIVIDIWHLHGSWAYQSSITLMNKGVKTKYNKVFNILSAIDLSSNKFTGLIPESFGDLDALQLLDLSNNELTGPIPPSLGNLRQLESLDLSLNKLSGVIPQQLAGQLNFLAFFNVSYNLLSGHIPQGTQFRTFNNNSYMSNSRLCGFPLSKNCGTAQSPLAANHSDEDKFPSGFDWVFILAGLGSGLILGFVGGNIIMDPYI